MPRSASHLCKYILTSHHIKIIIAHTQCLESSRNIHRIVANIGGHSQHCIDIHIDKTKRAGGSPGVSCCLSYVASTGNCAMQNIFLEEELAYFRCVLKNQTFYLIFSFKNGTF